MKIFSSDPKLGFLSHARWVGEFVASGSTPPGVKSIAAARHMMFNDRLDAAVAGFFMAAVVVVLFESVRVWIGIGRGRIPAVSTETKFSHTRDFLVDATAG